MFPKAFVRGNIEKGAEEPNMLSKFRVSLYYPRKKTKVWTDVLYGADGCLRRYLHDHHLVNGPGWDLFVIQNIGIMEAPRSWWGQEKKVD